jgi:hypothetical protein
MNTFLEFEQNIVSKLYGMPSWHVVKGYSSFITCEFGEPQLDIHERLLEETYHDIRYMSRQVSVHGVWHLWIYCCDWRILLNGQQVCHSESPDSQIQEGCRILDGQALKKLTIAKDTWRTNFQFDLGGTLQTRPYHDDDENNKQWLLFCPDTYVFSWYSDGSYTYEHDTHSNETSASRYFVWE